MQPQEALCRLCSRFLPQRAYPNDHRNDTWVLLDFFALVTAVNRGDPLTCMHALEIQELQVVAFHPCDDAGGSRRPDLSTDWLMAPAAVTVNDDSGFDATFDIANPTTGETFQAEINLEALVAETEGLERIQENAEGFLELTSPELATSTDTSFVYVIRLSTYEQVAAGD